jgi:hypothetical protein
MLVEVPLRDQLAEPTADHQPDENARANCVPASLSAALSALTGRPFFGDQLKDAVYGEAYTGATDPARFVSYAAQQGVRMWEVRGAGATLAATIAAEVVQGHPVYGAIPSFWGNTTAADIAAHGGPTHAVMFCDASRAAGTLTAMNPWPVNGHSAFYQTMPLAWWASRLVYGHVFPLAREEGGSPMAFIKQPDGSARDDKTGVVLHFGMAAYVLAHNVAQHALLAETYYSASDSFVPCDGGLVLTYNKAENIVRADRGGEALLAVWNELAAANSRATAATDQARGLAAQVTSLQAQLAQAQQAQPTVAEAAASSAIRALAAALADVK